MAALQYLLDDLFHLILALCEKDFRTHFASSKNQRAGSCFFLTSCQKHLELEHQLIGFVPNPLNDSNLKLNDFFKEKIVDFHFADSSSMLIFYITDAQSEQSLMKVFTTNCQAQVAEL